MSVRFLSGFVLAAVAALPGAANAAHCGLCRYPAPCVAPEQCCPPVVTHRVAYQTVVEQQTEVCYRPVYRTVCQPESYTSYRTVRENHTEAVPYTVNRLVKE